MVSSCTTRKGLLVFLFLSFLVLVGALFEDEAGLADFVIRSSGGANYVGRSNPMAVVPTLLTATKTTTPTTTTSRECFLSSRRLDTGRVVWRKVLPSSRHKKQKSNCPSVSQSEKTMVVSLGQHNETHVLSAWDVRLGDLLWQEPLATNVLLCRVEMLNAQWVAAYSCQDNDDDDNNNNVVQLYNAQTGKFVKSLDAHSVNQGARMDRVMVGEDDSTLLVFVHNNHDDQQTLSVARCKIQDAAKELQIVSTTTSLTLNDPAIYYSATQVSVAHWDASAQEMVLQSLELQKEEEPLVTRISMADLVAAAASEENSQDDWTRAMTDQVRMQFKSRRFLWVEEAGFVWDAKLSQMAVPPPQKNAMVPSAIAVCETRVMVATRIAPSVDTPLYFAFHSQVYFSDSTFRLTIPHVEITSLHVVDCGVEKMTAYATANDGAVSLLLEGGDGDGTVRLVWKCEESLAAVSHAIMVEDEQHEDAAAVTTTTTGGGTLSSSLSSSTPRLDWKHRWQLQYKGLEQSLQELQESLQSWEGLNKLWTLATSSSSPGATTTATTTSHHKDHVFGFAKVAILLSESMHRLVGVETLASASSNRIRWSLPLIPQASWHKLVRGDVTSRFGVSGGLIHQHAYSSHVLILSLVRREEFELHWTCVDGIHGRPLDYGSLVVPHDVVQVIPLQAMPAKSWACGSQVAAVLLDNDTLLPLPDEDVVRRALSEAAGGPNATTHGGLFVHRLNAKEGRLQTLRVVVPPSSSSLSSSLSNLWPTLEMGRSMWNVENERILQPPVYPAPHEVVQSPTAILGDDSLLLKYLNPHVAVVVTWATPEWLRRAAAAVAADDGDGGDAFTKSLLETAQDGGKGTAKPLGVTPKPEDASTFADDDDDDKKKKQKKQKKESSTFIPTLFVYLIDTVSGDVLHQTSHAPIATDNIESAAALLQDTSQLPQIPILISENWIVYAFGNFKTRRTEVGVWTLHEGMIDKHGISAFRGLDQEYTFSSLASPKPIVLTKTFCVATPVTALGVTQTRSGISSKQVLLATGLQGQVAAMDRKWLDPRRPLSEPKMAEKEEGLQKYNPLLPLVSLRFPSYHQYVSCPTRIVSMAAHVESHSLILAFGGADVFFTRVAPSKGFDLLPDSFNRPLLTVVVLGLLTVLWTLRRMSQRKMVKMGWM